MPRRKKHNILRTFFIVAFVGVIAYLVVQNNITGNETSSEEEVVQKVEDSKDDNPDLNTSEETKEKSEELGVGGSGDQEDVLDKNIYETKLAGQRISFEYPDTMQANKLDEKNKFSFGPKGKAVAAEYQGDIVVIYKENENEMPIERYYDGLNDINLFEDASSGFEKEEEGRYVFYKFKDVIGYTPSTIGVFVLSDSFVEMNDVYNKHQDNGVFDQLIQSFQAE